MHKPGPLNNAGVVTSDPYYSIIGGLRPPVLPRLPSRTLAMPSPYRSLGGYGYNNSYYSGYSNAVPSDDEPSVFKSFEAAVRAFTSLADMIESTFQAMMLSYRAVVSVATNMTKLNDFLFSVLTGFSSLRTISWFYYWIRRALGLVSRNSEQENVWSQSQANGSRDVPRKSYDFKSLIAMILMLGTPYAVYKLLNNDQKKKPTGTVEAEAIFDFEGQGDSEISFEKGERFLVALSVHPGWLVAKKDGKTGYVPQNRLKLMGPLSKTKKVYRLQNEASNSTGNDNVRDARNRHEMHSRVEPLDDMKQKVKDLRRIMAEREERHHAKGEDYKNKN